MVFNIEEIQEFVTINSFEKNYLGKIIHSIPGRMRIYCSWLRQYPHLEITLKEKLTNLTMIKEIYISLVNKSVIIYYDTTKISEEKMQIKIFKIFADIVFNNNFLNQDKLNGTNIAKPNDTPLEIHNIKIISIEMQKFGARLIGSTIGSLLLSPLGLISGGHLAKAFASAIGRLMGSQIGEHTVPYWFVEATPIPEKLEKKLRPALILESSLKSSAIELIGESLGAIVGLILGSLVFGQIGAIVCSAIGGIIGGQILEIFGFRDEIELCH